MALPGLKLIGHILNQTSVTWSSADVFDCQQLFAQAIQLYKEQKQNSCGLNYNQGKEQLTNLVYQNINNPQVILV